MGALITGFSDELLKLAEEGKMLHVPVAEADKPKPVVKAKPKSKPVRRKPATSPSTTPPPIPPSKHPDYRMVPGGWQQREAGKWTTHKGTPPSHVMDFITKGPYDPPPKDFNIARSTGKVPYSIGSKTWQPFDLTYPKSRGGQLDPNALTRFELSRRERYEKKEPEKALSMYKDMPDWGEPPKSLLDRIKEIRRQRALRAPPSYGENLQNIRKADKESMGAVTGLASKM